MKGLFAIAITTVLVGLAFSNSDFTSDEFIQHLNEKAVTWKARKNFENYTNEQLKKMTSEITFNASQELPIMLHQLQIDGIPDTFDSRSVWPECASIKSVRNQGQCGSCWAFATVEVMSDRLCIFSAGAKQFTFSAEELVSCCKSCGNGCSGGSLTEPYVYWMNNGIPSGGDEGTNYGCRPYTAASTGKTPECNERCVLGYSKPWADDIRHGIASFIVTNTVEQMQHEIMINGPVSSYFVVYKDFYNYGSGVYQQTSGEKIGDHVVKIIGWGTENGVPYWLAANSWGDGFGDHGFFKIIRGTNDCQIESFVTAGNPNINE